MTPGWGASLRLPRRVGVARAKEMLFSARLIDTQSAFAWGLIDRVGTSTELQEQLDRFAAEVALCSAAAIGETKRLLHAAYDQAVDHSLAAEAAASARCIAGNDARQRIANFLARRQKRTESK
jgi:enoyl-CoA hydratase